MEWVVPSGVVKEIVASAIAPWRVGIEVSDMLFRSIPFMARAVG